MKKKTLIILIVSIVSLAIAISVITYSRHSCSDRTYIGDCSIPRHGYYCDESKNLIFNCAYCGCPLGDKQVCVNNTCIEK